MMFRKDSNIVTVDDDGSIQTLENFVSSMYEFPNCNIESNTNLEANSQTCLNVEDSCEKDAVNADVESDLQQKGPFLCDICGKIFKYNSHFIIHYRRHTNDKPFCCPKCDMKFPQKSSVAKHLKVHSDEKPFVCDICFCSFKSERYCSEHRKRHTVTDKKHKCTMCSRSFLSSSDLNRHQHVHSDSRPYVCEICNMSFKLKAHLKNHLHIHSDERKFICEICNKAFKRRSDLLSHVRNHTGERPHICEVCNKGFVTKKCLREHSVSHTKVKDYVCSNCNKRYHKHILLKHFKYCKGPSNLIKEMEEKHVCVICTKRFATPRRLLRHSYIHLKDKLFNCDKCGKGYNFIYDLDRHLCMLENKIS